MQDELDWTGQPKEPSLNDTNWFDNAEGRARTAAMKNAPRSDAAAKRALSNAFATADLDRADDVERAKVEKLAAQYDPDLDLKLQREEKALGDNRTPAQRVAAGYFEPVRAAAVQMGIAVTLDDEHANNVRKAIQTARADRDAVEADPKSTAEQRENADIALHSAISKFQPK